jgi:cellobiose phosphorylase
MSSKAAKSSKPAKPAKASPSKKPVEHKPAPRAEVFGGLAAREGKGPLWKFTDKNDGSFVMRDPDYITGLYFPLFNMAGQKSYVTPELKGDMCTDFHNFLTIPQVTEDFHLSRASRNFWVSVDRKQPWSATGCSAFAQAAKWVGGEESVVEGGFGWFRTIRTNKDLGLKATTTVFVPSAPDMVEIMVVDIENITRKDIKATCLPASPIFGRSADNARDHRQVTSMFNEVDLHKHGVIVKARIHHDEKGHRPNKTNFGIFVCNEKGDAPKEIWSNMKTFVGEGGSLDNPEAVFRALPAPQPGKYVKSGVESVCAARFAPVVIKPGKTSSYVMVRAISDDRNDFANWIKKYGARDRVESALAETVTFWKKISDEVYVESGSSDIDNLIRWITFQPFCRKIYGNSYLPDHDYGRGGRGWRDLWSDMLGLFLVDPANTREDIINNLHGIRIDGTNATIIGHKPGEFVADRNNIVRMWSDHGTWPFFILRFYMDHTGDFEILLKEITYWKDSFICRSKARDDEWNDAQGNAQLDAAGAVYKGSIFEHILVQQLSSFFNVGEHNNILLEGGDWNDTYDMGRDRGESVCFYNWYGWNLRTLAETLESLDQKGIKEIPMFAEIAVLLDTLPGQWAVNYGSPADKQRRLKEYFGRVRHSVTGAKTRFSTRAVADDLRKKATHVYEHIRRNEWITTKDDESFFNGHYDNDSVRVHGDHANGVRMDLSSQVLPILFDVATSDQVAKTHRAVMRYLRNPGTGGLRLTSDLKELKLNYGRVTGFVYGFRENGSIWSQMNAMYMYALYCRGFVKEAYSVFKETTGLCLNSGVAKTFPNLPSCFHVSGKGLSSYLTGSATWFVVAVVGQMYGVRGAAGNLCINPKLVKEQFDANRKAVIHCNFLGKKLKVTFVNSRNLDWDKYHITAATLNGNPLGKQQGDTPVLLTVPKEKFLKLADRDLNEVEVLLG